MNKEEALKLIDAHKNKLIDPSAMLHWTWLRVIVLNIPDDAWSAALHEAVKTLAR